MKNLNYEQMDLEHQKLLARIRSHEDDKQAEPLDKLVVNLNLANCVEVCQEYIDDPESIYARDENGQLLRLKLKITLSYQPNG